MNSIKLNRLYTLVCFTVLCICGAVNAQSVGTEFSGTVVDDQGNPLAGVNIYGSENSRASTDVNGSFLITLANDDLVRVEKNGYESQFLDLFSLTGDITLQKSDFLASENDVIKMGVTTKDRREVVGSVSSVNTKDRLTYDNTQFIRDYLLGLTVGVRGSSNVRGLGNALFVIDGVFGRDPNVLNMEEVDQITVLKDANAVALYGSQGRNGVIIINTKRGKINKKEVNVNVRSGFRLPIALPNYLGAADYMELRNEAFANDGQDPSIVGFSAEQIQNTRSGLNSIQYPDVDLYDYVNSMVRTNSVISEFSGGNMSSQYYVNVGWNNSQSWVDINDDINEGSNRFNVRGNIDFKVNDWITSSIDGVVLINNSRGSRANILSASTSFIPNNYPPLIPVSFLDTENNPDLETLLAGANVFNGNLLGSTQQFGVNAPVANAIAGGYQNRVTRGTQFNNAINFDLTSITEGLSAKTYLSFDFFEAYTTSISNQYRTYAITGWEDGKITGLQDFGQDRRDLSENVASNGFVSRIGAYALVNYEKSIAEAHSLSTTLLGYYNSEMRDGRIQTDKDAHLALQATYDFKKKLFVDFSGSYVHSIKLPEGNRGGFSPTVGLGYILSEESFLKDSKFVNYLKVKASGGIIKSDRGINGYYLYDENYADGSSFTWADDPSNRKQNISQGANPNLGYEERLDLNIGVESYLMNSLWLEANVFKTELDKQLVFLADQYPSYYNTFRPMDNFNANLYTGFELGLNYNKSINDFSISVGSNVLYSQTEASKRSETNEFAYQNRQGLELSTIYGFEDLGFYKESDFTTTNGERVLNSGLPVPNFGAVHPGDIRYADQNGDNIIDQNDRIAIGQSSSPWSYGVNLNLKYKSFNLFVLGTGQTGGLGNKLSGSFNDYYTPNGSDKYSDVVLGRWTPQTADTATFPRLSAKNNQNNFRTSSFWLYDTTFFRINRAQLTFEFDDSLCDTIGVEDFSLNLQGTNLFEVGPNKDIRQLNIGSSPQARSFTLGVRVSF